MNIGYFNDRSTVKTRYLFHLLDIYLPIAYLYFISLFYYPEYS